MKALCTAVLVLYAGVAFGSSLAISAEHRSFVGNLAEIAAIRRILPTEVCAQAEPAYIDQAGRYAITEGSWGEAEMHAALVKTASTWRVNRSCRWGGGMISNDVLNSNLVAYGFPNSVASKLVKLRWR